jgi:hypothetical protein
MITVNRDGTPIERAMGMLLFIGGLMVCASVTWSFSKGVNQTMVAMLLGAILIIISLVAPVIGICAMFIWLAILGDVRRLWIFDTGVVENDPLLMIGPAVAIVIATMPFLHGRYDFTSRLPRMILILMIFMMVQVANPIQGGLMVGLAGGMFYLIPLTWFWIGQQYGTEENFKTLIMKVVVVVGVAGCLLAMWQTFFDFLPYQAEWVRIMRTRFLALNVGSRVRPFGFFVSPAEFAHYCTILVMLGMAPLVKGKLRPVALLVPLAGACILFQGGRGPLVTAGVGALWMWALSAKRLNGVTVLGRLSLGAALGLGAVVFGLGAVSNATNISESIAPMLERQASGLLNPLDEHESTAIGHVQLGLHGFVLGFKFPMGMGLGASTPVGSKFASGNQLTGYTEIDITNMFVSLGFVGGFLYFGIVCYIMWLSWKLVWKTQSTLSLIIFGILISQLSQWLNGQHYATSAIVWFCVGVLYRQHKALERQEREEAALA